MGINVDSIDVLVSTMNQNVDDFAFVMEMGITTGAIVCNQSDTFDSRTSNKITILTTNQKGVGLSRNTALLSSNADICVLSDDDMVFINNYEEIVKSVFERHQDADVIIFNISDGGSRFVNEKDRNVSYLNYKRYGAARIAFKRKSILNNDIYFSSVFGGGTIYGSGEDTLFLRDCLKNKLKIIAVTETIAELKDNRESTWFKGYNEKFYFDKGALYYAISPWSFLVNVLQYSVRKSSLSNGEIGIFKTISLMINGARSYKIKQSFEEYTRNKQ